MQSVPDFLCQKGNYLSYMNAVRNNKNHPSWLLLLLLWKITANNAVACQIKLLAGKLFSYRDDCQILIICVFYPGLQLAICYKS